MRRLHLLIGVAAIAFGLLGCRGTEDNGEALTEQQTVSADLEPLLNNYFASWSNNDLEAY